MEEATQALFAPEARRRLVLKPGKERVVANRHPWIFAGAIARESGPDDAAIADLVDGRGVRMASGLYSRHSQIRLRALTFDDADVTTGMIRDRIAAAAARRRTILDESTNAARIVHAEGDDVSGLVIDRYDDLVVVEIANNGLERIRPLIIDAVRAELGPRMIHFKNDLSARKLERLPAAPESIGRGEPVAEIRESGLRFHVDPTEGQKTGFFLDQRENRRLARDLASERRVLNLFSYSGAFGVYAAAGGASHVENVDVSAKAVELAKVNHDLNGVAGRASFLVADAFGHVRERAAHGAQFDLIVCDPPAFAKSRADVERAARGYKDINLYALRLLAPGGMLMTFSCSGHMPLDLFQKIVFAAALDAGRRVSFIRRLTAGPDHPISLYCPEGEYLKGFLLAAL
ncbi:MAG TPA: class I SAM-dependent rRNA methyltransferase [Thermoanaerobaculia bacterium]|nr:class I SAM-dependent rRNA methyltransferase [Thermoanaerobaculia bacterium]